MRTGTCIARDSICTGHNVFPAFLLIIDDRNPLQKKQEGHVNKI